MFIFFTGFSHQKNWEVSTDQWLQGLHFEEDPCLGNLGGGYAKLSLCNDQRDRSNRLLNTILIKNKNICKSHSFVYGKHGRNESHCGKDDGFIILKLY